MKIGICGGTFDPFHRGHLDPILAVRDQLGWDRVLFVPAYVQPFKRDRQTASGYHRYAMAVLATEEWPGLTVSPRELERGAVSYTVDTLEELHREFPGAALDWVIGDDNLAGLNGWKSIDRIFDLAGFVVLRRGTAPVPEALSSRVVARAEERGRAGAIAFAENPTVAVSSTEIRRRVAAGEPITDLVCSQVSRYIDRYALYRKGNS